MLSPKELYQEYSRNPCTSYLRSPFTQINAATVYNQLSANDMGAGTPMNWLRIINFLKLCISYVPIPVK